MTRQPDPADTLREALAEFFAEPDHDQCRSMGPQAEADCFIAGMKERDIILAAAPTPGLDVRQLRDALMLARSMILSRESMTPEASALIASALAGQERGE